MNSNDAKSTAPAIENWAAFVGLLAFNGLRHGGQIGPEWDAKHRHTRHPQQHHNRVIDARSIVANQLGQGAEEWRDLCTHTP